MVYAGLIRQLLALATWNTHWQEHDIAHFRTAYSTLLASNQFISEPMKGLQKASLK